MAAGSADLAGNPERSASTPAVSPPKGGALDLYGLAMENNASLGLVIEQLAKRVEGITSPSSVFDTIINDLKRIIANQNADQAAVIGAFNGLASSMSTLTARQTAQTALLNAMGATLTQILANTAATNLGLTALATTVNTMATNVQAILNQFPTITGIGFQQNPPPTAK